MSTIAPSPAKESSYRDPVSLKLVVQLWRVTERVRNGLDGLSRLTTGLPPADQQPRRRHRQRCWRCTGLRRILVEWSARPAAADGTLTTTQGTTAPRRFSGDYGSPPAASGCISTAGHHEDASRDVVRVTLLSNERHEAPTRRPSCKPTATALFTLNKTASMASTMRHVYACLTAGVAAQTTASKVQRLTKERQRRHRAIKREPCGHNRQDMTVGALTQNVWGLNAVPGRAAA